ncbi:MAG: peptidyl-prolyl cis-trans isomerase, partial [Dysgonamonadaceae bacterium]|nr:peptidyl-prolyl cis-trans isomerase [Dysgonamonadaceae bacterium]
KQEENNGTPVAKAGDRLLTKQILEENIPAGLSPNDSIIETEHFIRTWITDVLMYDIAEKNTGDKEDINRMVENYRKSLVIYQYQEQLINEKVIKQIREEDLYNYYTENKEKFKLDRYIVKGVFLKVPVGAPDIKKIRESYKSVSSAASREKLEKYSVRNAVIFDHFLNTWVSFDELKSNWPEEGKQSLVLKRGENYFERQDTSFYYFLNVSEFLPPGEFAPFEYAMPIVREMLVNRLKIDFLKKTEKDIYQRALNRGEIKFYN